MIKRIVRIVLLTLPIVLLVYAIASKAVGKTPTLFGYSMSVVVTPSMQDILPVGSIILSREVQPEDELREGDIITYHGTVGTYYGKRITHRIERIEENDAGEVAIVTKGTNNPTEDPPIDREQVESVLVKRIIRLGRFYEFVTQPIGFVVVIVLPILAVITAEGICFIRIFRRDGEEDVSNENGKPENGQ